MMVIQYCTITEGLSNFMYLFNLSMSECWNKNNNFYCGTPHWAYLGRKRFCSFRGKSTVIFIHVYTKILIFCMDCMKSLTLLNSADTYRQLASLRFLFYTNKFSVKSNLSEQYGYICPRMLNATSFDVFDMYNIP